MPYDPDEHGRLESLYLKYGARLQSEARTVREFGSPQFAGHDLAQHYEDALATAHAVYAYLLAHPAQSQPTCAPRHPRRVNGPATPRPLSDSHPTSSAPRCHRHVSGMSSSEPRLTPCSVANPTKTPRRSSR